MLSVCKRLFGVLGLGLTVAVLAGPISQATPPRTYVRYLCDIDSVSYDRSTGIAEARLFVRIEHPTACQELDVSIEELRGVDYTGPMQWSGTAVMGKPWSTRLRLNVPYGDTTGVVVRTNCSEWGEQIWPLYFVFPEADSVGITDGDPREWPDPDPLPDSVEHRQSWEEMQRQFVENKKKPPVPSEGTARTYIPIAPGDSALADSLTEEGKGRLAVMRARENEPLTSQEIQTWVIEGRWFQRHRGERHFRRVEPATDQQLADELRRFHDSVEIKMADQLYEILVDLRKREVRDFVRSLADTVIETEDEGIFRVTIKRRYLKQLESRRIDYDDPSSRPRRMKSAPEKKSEADSTDSALTPLQESSREELLFEDFEGYFGLLWEAYDLNSSNGEDYWGSIVDQYAHGGLYSAWCAAEGDQPSGVNYDNNMDSFMELTWPVSTYEYTNAKLTFYVDYLTEENVDFLQVYASCDGFTWVAVSGAYHGDSGGWTYVELPVASVLSRKYFS